MSTAPDLLQLQQPLTDGGIRSVNFFNGRLLSGKDLSREQGARREADSRLGLAGGSGVSQGLGVVFHKAASAPGKPVVRVSTGLAVNRLGQTLRLTRDTSIALVRSFEASSVDCLFGNCTPLAGGTYVAGAGLYLLTIAPAALSEGRAATSGLDPAHVRCNTDATVEALQFRLLRIDRKLYADLDWGAASFRNEISYRCFGAGVQPTWFANLLGAPARGDDLLDGLRGLQDDDVPLALLFFTGTGDLQFIDTWAVRRDVTRPDGNGPFASLTGERRVAVGRAMFLQFQAHVASLVTPAGDLGGNTARGSFRYLPPVGVIPVLEEVDATDAMATRFFKDMTYRGPAFINGARLEGLLGDGLCFPPVDTQSGEFIWLYRVRENRRANNVAATTPLPRSYLVFASAHLPYCANAHFDSAYWNYGNYGLV